MTNREGRRGRRGGFTLIEVLLVLAILVIIASFAVMAYGPIQRKAYSNAAKTQVKLFEECLEHYQFDVNQYPTSAQGLEALRNPPGDLANSGKWNGPYLKRLVPLDPWERPYQYEYPGRRNVDMPDIWSMGPDGADGTDDDVGNWEE